MQRRGYGITLGVALALLQGCTTVDARFERLPPEASFSAIEPGVTTRSEVLARLGPPEELRRPALYERARDTSPQLRRVLEGADLFRNDTYTYAVAERRVDRFGILPVGLPIFRLSWATSLEDRWHIEFDERDVVLSVSKIEEIR